MGYRMRIEYTLKYRDYLLFNAAHCFLSVPVQIFVVALCLWLSSLSERSLSGTLVFAGVLYIGCWIIQFASIAISLAGKIGLC